MIIDKEHTNIRKIRESLGLSQAAMADELGIGRTTYVNFENGKTRIYNKTLSKLAGYVGMSEREVLLGTTEDKVLSDNDWEEERKELILDYEKRLQNLRERCQSAEQVISAQQITIKTLSDSNKFLLKQLGKDE